MNNKLEKNNNKQNKPMLPKFNFYWIYVVLAAFLLGFIFLNNNTAATKINWNEFEEKMLAPGEVEKLVGYKKNDLFLVEIYIDKAHVNDQKYLDLSKKDHLKTILNLN